MILKLFCFFFTNTILENFWLHSEFDIDSLLFSGVNPGFFLVESV